MEWQINKGRKRSPVKKGTLIDVVLFAGYAHSDNFSGSCIAKQDVDTPYSGNLIVVRGTPTGETIVHWELDNDIGDILLWREYKEGVDNLPSTDLIEEVLNNG